MPIIIALKCRTRPRQAGEELFTFLRATDGQRSDGTTREWRSEVVPRYQRRTTRVDEAILGLYLTGTNSRRVKSALTPLLRGAIADADDESWTDRDRDAARATHPPAAACKRAQLNGINCAG